MDIQIELDSEGRIWVSAPDAAAPEEAWLQRADDTLLALRAQPAHRKAARDAAVQPVNRIGSWCVSIASHGHTANPRDRGET